MAFLRWLGLRLAFSVVVLLVLSAVVFLATTVLPGNVADVILGQSTTPAARAALQHQLGLDQPAFVRYLRWLGSMARLDFGTSLQSGQPVWPVLAERARNSLLLAGLAAAIMFVLSLGLGVLAGIRRGGWLDTVIVGGTFAGISTPPFVLGSLLIWVFAIGLAVVPSLSLVSAESSAGDWVRALVLPVIAVMPVSGAYILRTMRSAVISVVQQDFVQMASLRGVPWRREVLRHVIPNALIPMVNVLGVNLGYLVGGLVVIEVLFQYPGIGQLLLQSVQQRDVPVVQAAAMVIGVVFVVVNLLSDIAIALLDPKIRQNLS